MMSYRVTRVYKAGKDYHVEHHISIQLSYTNVQHSQRGGLNTRLSEQGGEEGGNHIEDTQYCTKTRFTSALTHSDGEKGSISDLNISEALVENAHVLPASS